MAARRPARVGQLRAPARREERSPAVVRCGAFPWVPCWLGCGRPSPRPTSDERTSMHDLVIRGGTVVDGTGAPTVTADVAIDDGVIVEVGRVETRGRRELDADGLLVTPGLRRRAHPLRRPGHVGPAPHAVVLARRDHRGARQLRRRLRAGRARSSRVAHRADGGCRGHPRQRPLRGHGVGLGDASPSTSTPSNGCHAPSTSARTCRTARSAAT